MPLNKAIMVMALLGAGASISPALTSPPLTDYVTYLGGTGAESVAGIAVDAGGSEYIAGTTNSPNFPVTSTSLGTPSAASSCAFVTKFNPSGDALDFSICIANSRAQAFGVDAAGNLYLAIEPVSAAFTSEAVVKLDRTGENILYSVSIGVAPESMAVDMFGNVYLAGAAASGLDVTAGAYQPQPAPGGTCYVDILPAPCTDAFVMKLNPSGGVAWATYLGGSGPDDAHTIAIDSTGSPWIAGATVSPNFPVTANALESTFHGEIDLGPLRFGDAFVAKFDPTGGKLLYSTYLGGNGPDAAFALAIDAADSAYVTGGTQSPDFPTTTGALQTVYNGLAGRQPGLVADAFVTKFSSSGQVVYSTFLGGPNSQGTAIVVNGSGQAAVNAAGSSSGAASACTRAPAVTVLNAAGSVVAATSPVGGSYLTEDSEGRLYSVGETETLVFLTTPGAYQTQYGGGGSDAYAAQVDFSRPAVPAIASVLNAATMMAGGVAPLLDGEVAPGELVTLFGNGFGSSPAVVFGGVNAPVLYASTCQINAVVPFEMLAGQQADVRVQSSGQTVGPVELPIVPAAPGLFTINESGSGQAAVVNQDSTINSASNPAPRGSIVSVYMTGTGALKPAVADGSFGPVSQPFPAPIQDVTAEIGLVVAPVLFAGQAPTLIAGATQLNIMVPQNAPTGSSVAVAINVGGYLSQAVVIAVGPAIED